MASEYSEPAAPQTHLNTHTSHNRQAAPGTYVDPDLTLENVDSTPAAELDVPPPSGSTTLGGIRPFYANDQAADIDNTAAATENAGVEPPPHSPNKWGIETVDSIPRSRDPYRNNGLDSYLRNGG